MKTTIYLVRHGDVHNPRNVLYERLEGFPLSNLGRTQAHALGRFLSTKTLSHIYASPLERTKETAGIIASYQADVGITYEERIIEVSTPLRGSRMEVLAATGWDFYTRRHIRAGGERLGDIWRRMSRFLHEAVRKHAGEKIAVVSHGDPIMISMIKHQGKRLNLGQIRGEDYIGTAKGFALIFEKFRAIEVSKLDF